MTQRRDSTERICLSAAVPTDLAQIEQLLLGLDLPVAGLVEQFPRGYVVARDEAGRVTGVAGLERYDSVGLLRSVGVSPSRRNAGLGRALVTDRLAYARELRLLAVYLLTTTAESYFARLGFTPASRAQVPGALGRAAEFAGACPATAVCLE